MIYDKATVAKTLKFSKVGFSLPISHTYFTDTQPITSHISPDFPDARAARSEEHTSELQSR